MIQTVRLESTDSVIIYVQTQHDYEEALKYVAGTEYEVVPYDTMVRKVKGNGNVIVIGSRMIQE